METKVGESKGYGIFYDSGKRRFLLKNSDYEEVGSGGTQEEVEGQADKLRKQSYPFPIYAIFVSSGRPVLGKVTSLNPQDRSVRFSYAEKYHYHYHTKSYLTSGDLYKLTDHNKEVVQQIEDRQARIKDIEGEIEELVKTFDNPMDLKYFNLGGY